jgi:hypothetical protein
VVASGLIPRLAVSVAAVAPGVCLRVVGEADTNVDGLRRGNVDLELSDKAAHPADVRSTTVMTDSLATIGRRDLPPDPATIRGFAALHARHEQDTAHRWLRAMISNVFTSITDGENSTGRAADALPAS